MSVTGWIPEEERTSIWYLFNILFHVRVNPHQIRTVEEIQDYGTPTTGNEDYDRELQKAETVVMLNIAQMEDIYHRGYPVKIIKEADTKIIYEHISNHLVKMKELLGFSENVTGDPQTMDELIRLDKFAGDMFEHARYGMRADYPQSSFAKRFSNDRFKSLGKLSRGTKAAEPADTGPVRDYSTGDDVSARAPTLIEEPQEREKVDDPSLPKRVSLANLFEDRKRLGTRWN